MVNAESIKTMKKGVRLINCARGGIIDEGALYDALESGQVGGAALDVFEVEPPAADYKLMNHPKVICTPHLGASTDEAQINVAVAVAEQIVDYLKHGTIRNAVNFPSIPQDQVAALTPFIKLAEGLGSFAAQVVGAGIDEVTVEFKGEAAALRTEPIVIAALKGVLTPVLEETVNFVNAPFIARERGIEVKEIKSSDAGDYQNMLKLSIRSGEKTHTVAGTLFGRKDPRIIAVDGFPVEIIPEGTVIVVYNNDKPGVIGNVGSLMARYSINIAWMHFGRETVGGMAITVVAVDTPVTDEQMEELRALPNILSARQIYL
jgi:D-3-phosphoglycerate dehydrogenase